ncbi:ubiquitin [Desulfosporosinus sp.]|uniref:ubiquitin n=1 Tax=Desulfosporosinus sp. TaxID=157907 RepID=UPI000E95C262|nr:ubiquitin [Desulfosporosinus sp.]MBC2723346.1 ubiquitin [Desulfosporosinus sp.]MBC2725169.1 ubiquitin [Desulfosporosinus sp.]HBV87230.1 ubiquitin [Desulfosporosinus sp.]
MTTLEQVEKLRAMANVTYDEAKTALEAANGDLLEAIIYLEKQGKVNEPSGGGYYSSQKTSDTYSESYKEGCWDKKAHCHHHGAGFSSMVKKLGHFCMKLIRKGNANSFEVLKGEESKASAPVTGFALLLIFAPWITIPLIIIGLFFGFRYRFNGPDFSNNTVNDAINSAADAAVNLKKSMDK